jgi:hypothetical protein
VLTSVCHSAGDNRDATYLLALPMVTLNKPGEMLLVAGVNYVAEGEQQLLMTPICVSCVGTQILACHRGSSLHHEI